MIKSVYKSVHYTGIIKILINTTDKWVDFKIEYGEHKLEFTFYEDDEAVSNEHIDMRDNFNPFKYVIYSNQCKDQITLILIPKIFLMNKLYWKEYDS